MPELPPVSAVTPVSPPQRAGLNRRIRQFYDASSDLWEQVWGEHMHHGYYLPGQPRPDRRQAQIDLIDRLVEWAAIESVTHLLDVGCGIGGSSLYLAQRWQARATGITLSPVQANRAEVRARAAGLDRQTTFQVADALAMPFADNHFDLVWTLESGEHMADKRQFLAECWRVLQPGGRLVMATWCHRAGELTANEQRHLAKIYDVYCLPYVISLEDYAAIATSLTFTDIRTADWSAAVAPFWNRVIESAVDFPTLLKVMTAGWITVRGALSLRLMSRGYARGLLTYGLLTATKPA